MIVENPHSTKIAKVQNFFNSNFSNFRKFRVENRTCATLIKCILLYSYEKFKEKKLEPFLRKFWKCPGCFMQKVPPKIKIPVSNSRHHEISQIDREVWILEKIGRNGLVASVVHRQTDGRTDKQTDVLLSTGFSVSRSHKSGILAAPRVRRFFS